jgi:hypothetical protein
VSLVLSGLGVTLLDVPSETTETTRTEDSQVPTHCELCGQRLCLLVAGRSVCERCRMGLTVRPAEAGESPSSTGHVQQRRPCRGCGRTELESGGVIALADGYCLLCRLDGLHL